MEDGARIGGGLGEADTSISTPAHNDSMSALCVDVLLFLLGMAAIAVLICAFVLLGMVLGNASL